MKLNKFLRIEIVVTFNRLQSFHQNLKHGQTSTSGGGRMAGLSCEMFSSIQIVWAGWYVPCSTTMGHGIYFLQPSANFQSVFRIQIRTLNLKEGED